MPLAEAAVCGLLMITSCGSGTAILSIQMWTTSEMIRLILTLWLGGGEQGDGRISV